MLRLFFTSLIVLFILVQLPAFAATTEPDGGGDDSVRPSRGMSELAMDTEAEDRWRLCHEAGANTFLLSYDFDWRDYRISDGRDLAARGQFSERGGAELLPYKVRFDLDDVYFQTRIDHRLGREGNVYVALGATPIAEHRTQAALRGGLSMPVTGQPSGEPVLMSFEGAPTSYTNADIAKASLWLRRSFLNDRLWLGGRGILVSDESSELQQGYALKGEFVGWQASSLILNYVDAPEISNGRTINVVSTSLGLHHDLTARTDISLTSTREDRQTSERSRIVIGVTRQF